MGGEEAKPSGVEVQKSIFAPVQALVTPMQTSFAPLQEALSGLPHWRAKTSFENSSLPTNWGTSRDLAPLRAQWCRGSSEEL